MWMKPSHHPSCECGHCVWDHISSGAGHLHALFGSVTELFAAETACGPHVPITDSSNTSAEWDTSDSGNLESQVQNATKAGPSDTTTAEGDVEVPTFVDFAEDISGDTFAEIYLTASMTLLTGLVILASGFSL